MTKTKIQTKTRMYKRCLPDEYGANLKGEPILIQTGKSFYALVPFYELKGDLTVSMLEEIKWIHAAYDVRLLGDKVIQ